MRYTPLRFKRYFKENPQIAQRTARRLKQFKMWINSDLGGAVPHKNVERSLLLATWNIRDFGRPTGRGRGERTLESLMYIAQVISAYDLVALQEVNADLQDFRDLMYMLGPDWDYILTDATESERGNQERMAFVYDRRKVSFRGIAGEITLAARDLIGGVAQEVKLPAGSSLVASDGTTSPVPQDTKLSLPKGQTLVSGKQFARTPFLVSFQAGWFKFNLCTVHLYFGSGSAGKDQRVQEIKQIGNFFKKRYSKEIAESREREEEALERKLGRALSAEEKKKIKTDVESKRAETYILLGDFNIVKGGDETMDALLSTGFRVPEELRGNPTNMLGTKHYDQIAFLPKSGPFRVNQRKAGVLQIFEQLYRASEDDRDLVEPVPANSVPDDPNSDFKIYYELMKAGHYRESGMKDETFKKHDRKRTFRMQDGSVVRVNKGDKRTMGQLRNWYYTDWRTYHMSDHLPMWVALEIDFSDDYLDRMIAEGAE